MIGPYAFPGQTSWCGPARRSAPRVLLFAPTTIIKKCQRPGAQRGAGDLSNLSFTVEGSRGTVAAVAPPANGRVTALWANEQAYEHWRNGSATVASLVAEYSNGHVATVTPEVHQNGDAFLLTVLTQNGDYKGEIRASTDLGSIRWDFPGNTGLATSEKLAYFGGLPFTPDWEWGVVQAYAFVTLTREAVEVSQKKQASALHRLVEAFAPTLHANTPGCDGMHWLDGTVFRVCCDLHDRCYGSAYCTYMSWFDPTGWFCTSCNVGVVTCFVLVDLSCLLDPPPRMCLPPA